jgi:hypothetical protein
VLGRIIAARVTTFQKLTPELVHLRAHYVSAVDLVEISSATAL